MSDIYLKVTIERFAKGFKIKESMHFVEQKYKL